MKSYFGKFWNKIKKVVFVFRTFPGKCLRRSPWTSSGKVKEKSACNFLEKNFTAVISQDFSNFQDVCLQDVSKKMSVQRSSFLRKLLSTSSKLSKKELYSSHLQGVFQKLWNKANKKAVFAFRTFLGECLWWSLFLEKLQTSACNLYKSQFHCSHLQGVSFLKALKQ